MPFRFRRTIKIAPGIRLNFNKKSASVRFGVRGAGITVSSTGKTTRTVGLPGTGLSWSETDSPQSGEPSSSSGAGCGLLVVLAIAVFAVVSALTLLAGCSQSSTTPALSSAANSRTTDPAAAPRIPTSAATPQQWRVTEVVDGDTVDVRAASGATERIRVIGIDTPERGECGYAEATAALAALVRGKPVTLSTGARDDRDRYGRLLRYIDVDGVDAGLQQIRTGFAIARYDSRDGYGRHARETEYVAADAASPNVCGRTAPASSTSSGAIQANPGPTQTFRNCAELNAVYPGGVARSGVTGNLVSGTLRPFGITPTFDDALYQANRSRDGDADGIACEK